MTATEPTTSTSVSPSQASVSGVTAADAGFEQLGVPPSIVDHLAARNIVHPTEVQRAAIGGVLRGRDLIVQAKTGTGKTFAFGLPLLTNLGSAEGPLPRALVITPTRELCLQVAADLTSVGAVLGLRCATVYGGQGFEPQVAALQAGVDLVVGTPGRLLDLVSRRHLDLSQVKHFVLDEADEMLDMGFFPDVQRLLQLAKSRTQTLLFSATMPNEVRALARTFMSNPTFTAVGGGEDTKTVSSVEQFAFQAHHLDKPEVLARILQADGRGPTIVFCRTKMTAQRVGDDMADRGFKASALHGDLSQPAREKALNAFRAGEIDVLVATDVAARGIDVQGVTHVVNYQAPEDAATYLHRIGRTARAGLSGTAVTLVDWDLLTRWNLIAKEIGLPSEAPKEIFSTSPELYELLRIPLDAKGKLPGARGHQPRGSSSRHGENARGSRRSDNRAHRDASPHSKQNDAKRGDRGRDVRTERTAVDVAASRPKRNRRRTRRGASTS